MSPSSWKVGRKSSLDASLPPSDENIAWLAGIYEGEGSVHYTRHHGRHVFVQIGQKDRWILDKIRAFVGGGISYNSHTRIHLLQLYGERAKLFLWLIYPYLSPHRQQQIGLEDYA